MFYNPVSRLASSSGKMSLSFTPACEELIVWFASPILQCIWGSAQGLLACYPWGHKQGAVKLPTVSSSSQYTGTSTVKSDQKQTTNPFIGGSRQFTSIFVALGFRPGTFSSWVNSWLLSHSPCPLVRNTTTIQSLHCPT
jgi:hypothetical protein